MRVLKHPAVSWPLLVLVAGCTVGPNYHTPKLDVPARFSEAAPDIAGAPQPDDWWTAFDDPELLRLIRIALAESPDIQSAASRVRQARLGVASARAQLFPEIDAQGNVTHLDFSNNAGISQLAKLFGGGSGSSGGIAIPGGGITTFAAGFDASWELDVFGGTRRKIEGARASAEQAQWSARDATLSLIAEIASQYFQLRSLQQRERAVRAQIANQTRTGQITGETSQVGLVPGGEDQRLRSQVATARATVDPVLVSERIQIHALAVLLGRNPAALADELSVFRPLPDTLPVVPPGLPSDLLRRRSDVRAAERRLAAATADIGVATADLYPKFKLTGTAELISSQLSTLISVNSKQLEGTAAVSFPLLDFGRIRTNIRSKREVAEQAWFDYQKTVLVALRDVEDALARIQGEQTTNLTLRNGYQNVTRAYAAADARFRVGLTDQTPALTAQASVLQAQLAIIDSDGALRTDLVSLNKALGGGWQGLPETPMPLETTRPYMMDRKRAK